MSLSVCIPVLLSFLVSVLLGPVIIPFLKRLKAGQTIRDEGPKSHLKKNGTPTMGGILILSAMIVTSLFYMKDYPEIFKIDPSFANLAKIREIEQERLLKEASYQGKLTEKDLYLILESLKNSEILTVKEKKRFGFIL